MLIVRLAASGGGSATWTDSEMQPLGSPFQARPALAPPLLGLGLISSARPAVVNPTRVDATMQLHGIVAWDMRWRLLVNRPFDFLANKASTRLGTLYSIGVSLSLCPNGGQMSHYKRLLLTMGPANIQ